MHTSNQSLVFEISVRDLSPLKDQFTWNLSLLNDIKCKDLLPVVVIFIKSLVNTDKT